MKRRVVLKNMAMAAGGLFTLPAWANGWTTASAQVLYPFLSRQQGDLLADIAETLIPESDTPGAKTLSVHKFIQKMVEDCYEKDVQDNLKTGLETVEKLSTETFGKPFADGTAAQRQETLRKLEISTDPAITKGFQLVKNLTIQGYTTSEYVMTKHLHYVMAPGHFYGCVPAPVKTASVELKP
ncbi:gluconate 2-dehydrogenase subunit 3 family protein [Spirosoma arcticum]